MKFRVTRNDFLKELQKIQSISVPLEKSNLPILSHFLISSAGDSIELFATNLDVGYRNRISASVQLQGSLTLEARKTTDIFRKLPPGTEAELFEGTKGWATIKVKAPDVTFTVATLPSEDFPSSPGFSIEGFVSIEVGVLREMIAKVEFAISPDETMRTLSGALLRSEGNGFLMVSTDGHRLARVRKKSLIEMQIPDAIIPRKALTEVKRLLDSFGEAETVRLKQEEDYMILSAVDIIFYCRLIKGNFPDYAQIVPKEFKRYVIINREGFLEALERVSTLSSERAKPVVVAFNKQNLELRSNSPEEGEAKENIAAELIGEEMEIGFNAKYLIETLRAIDEQEVEFSFIDPSSASLLKGKGNDEYFCVVMPMRV